MKARSVIAVCALVGVLWTAVAQAQEQSEPPAAPQDETTEAPEQPADEPEATEEPEGKKKIPFGLYVYAGAGSADVDEFNTSIVTAASHNSENLLEFDSATYARAAIGWKLANNKGDFRLIFNGFSEDGYTYRGVGRQSALPAGQGNVNVLQPLDWWILTIEDGHLHAIRTPPAWNLNDDANSNAGVDRDEVRYPTIDRDHMRDVADNLQNRWQNWDLVYGREWGPRRFQGRWFAGLRYFQYDGNMLASAWLNTADPGDGFTEGTFLRSLNFTQETSGVGPTGYLEARGNFFNQRLQLYLSGQVAFLLTDLKTDTGLFYTLVRTSTPPLVLVPLPAQLVEDRSKSIWNTNAEVGVRLKLKAGLEFDLAYQIQGYLDAVITPETIQIPQTAAQSAQGVSAVYNTQDIVLNAWRFGVGFQF